MKHAEMDAIVAQQDKTISLVGRAGLLATLCIALLGTLVPIAAAKERNDRSTPLGNAASLTAESAQSVDFANWPLLDLLDARTNIAIFFRSGVPAELRVAAFRRAWTVDASIRDFRGLSENEWDFENPNSIPGFGDLGAEVNVPTMVAEILGTPTRVAALSLKNEPASSSSLANTVRRLVFGTVHN
jgi:hypothetical protein